MGLRASLLGSPENHPDSTACHYLEDSFEKKNVQDQKDVILKKQQLMFIFLILNIHMACLYHKINSIKSQFKLIKASNFNSVEGIECSHAHTI